MILPEESQDLIKDEITPEHNRVEVNKVAIQNALSMHEEGTNYAFESDCLLSRLGQVLNMPKMSKLNLACPV